MGVVGGLSEDQAQDLEDIRDGIVNGIELLGKVSTGNSTSTTLGADETFTGEWEDCLNCAIIYTSLISDQDSAENGLVFEYSPDQIVIINSDELSVLANTRKTFSFQAPTKYFRVKYTNGSIAQTSFNLQTVTKTTYGKPSSHRILDPIVNDDDAELVKSVITGLKGSGTFGNVAIDEGNNLRVNSFPYTYAIAESEILGHDALLKFGTRTAGTTAVSTVWEGNTPLYQYLTTAEQLQVSSSSANDTAVTGTGARTLTIIGQDINNNEISETVNLNGLTQVTTSLSYYRIYRAFVETSGALATNAGKITITNNAGTQEQAVIVAGDGQTLMTLWTVPAGKVAYLIGLTTSSNSNKGAVISLFLRKLDGGIIYPWLIKYRAYSFSGANSFPFQIPFKIDEKTDIEVRIQAISVGSDFGATFELWYEDT